MWSLKKASPTIAISLNLYILKNVPRDELSRFEPVRTLFFRGARAIVPELAIFFEQNFMAWLPYLASGVFPLCQFCLFLVMRIEQPNRVAAGDAKRPSPVRFLRRFFRQPRLVLAWLLSVTRARCWGLFYNIAPVYLLTFGLEKQAIGNVTSLGSREC